ncbi:MAG TPA: tetratricopeptide repeat protein, partial [Saprospiraceae bacterium]|nr:tetratricopeptide repeat protein [Saprospiraceae bacterium]
KALEINPNYFEVHFSFGELLYDNAYFAEALEHFQKADTLDPNNDKVKWHLAECLYHLQRYNASYTLAKDAVKLNRKNVFAKSLLKLLNEPDIKRLRKKFPDQ